MRGSRALPVVVAAVACLVAVAPATTAAGRRVAYGPFSLVIPAGWSQRAVPEDWSPTSRYGSDSPVAQVSSTPLSGFDEGRMRPGQIVVFAFQLGRWGSKGLRALRRSDFVPTTGPGGIRATQAGGFSCLRGGRCFSLAVLIASPAPSTADVAVVNRVLSSLRAAPA